MDARPYMVEFPDNVIVMAWAASPEEAFQEACKLSGYPRWLALNAIELETGESRAWEIE